MRIKSFGALILHFLTSYHFAMPNFSEMINVGKTSNGSVATSGGHAEEEMKMARIERVRATLETLIAGHNLSEVRASF